MIRLLIALSAWGWGTEAFDGWPPARFTADNRATIQFVGPSQLEKACGTTHDPIHPLEACQNGRTMTLPNPCSFPRSDDYARLVCHELGHRNGWAGNHPR